MNRLNTSAFVLKLLFMEISKKYDLLTLAAFLWSRSVISCKTFFRQLVFLVKFFLSFFYFFSVIEMLLLKKDSRYEEKKNSMKPPMK